MRYAFMEELDGSQAVLNEIDQQRAGHEFVMWVSTLVRSHVDTSVFRDPAQSGLAIHDLFLYDGNQELVEVQRIELPDMHIQSVVAFDFLEYDGLAEQFAYRCQHTGPVVRHDDRDVRLSQAALLLSLLSADSPPPVEDLPDSVAVTDETLPQLNDAMIDLCEVLSMQNYVTKKITFGGLFAVSRQEADTLRGFGYE